jgi:hypothetical protein
VSVVRFRPGPPRTSFTQRPLIEVGVVVSVIRTPRLRSISGSHGLCPQLAPLSKSSIQLVIVMRPVLHFEQTLHAVISRLVSLQLLCRKQKQRAKCRATRFVGHFPYFLESSMTLTRSAYATQEKNRSVTFRCDKCIET